MQEEASQSHNQKESAAGGQGENAEREEQEAHKGPDLKEGRQNYPGGCTRCGRVGHSAEDCNNPVLCSKCHKEGHVARVCAELQPWDHIAPLCGFAAPGQGFFFIHSTGEEEGVKEMTNCALITITKGSVTARQLENEFTAQAGPGSKWRWYAKKVSENCFQMRFPTEKKVDELSFFAEMQMRFVPDVSFKVEKWSPSIGAKAEMQSAWFRIKGIPIEKRSERNICCVASFVGLPLQVDKANLKKFDYVRVKIGTKDITKVPAVVEGMLDFYFYDFEFQREVPMEGVTNVAGNKWIRVDKPGGGHPSPKKPRREDPQAMPPGSHQEESGPSGVSKGKGKYDEALMEVDRVKEGTSSFAPDFSAVAEDSEGESEDRGLQFGDILSPGCESLQFGSFQIYETMKIWTIQIGESVSTAINEYGSNLFKSKFDPLTAIEAKNALMEGKGREDMLITSKGNSAQVQEAVEELLVQPEKVGNMEEKALLQSPIWGSQEPPGVEWSSQEDVKELEMPEANEEKGDTEMVTEQAEEDAGIGTEGVESSILFLDDKKQEEVQREKRVEEEGQAVRRQSDRVKKQGLDHVKATNKAEALTMKKNLEGLQKGDDKGTVEEGAGMLKAAALHFHPQEAGQEDIGVVLLQ